MSTTKTKEHAFELVPLTVETRGEVIASNVDEFREMVTAALATINRDPKTDEEFGQAEQDVKALKDAEGSVTDAKAKALSDAEQLQALFASLDDTAGEIREARLELERQIKTKKAEVRDALIDKALLKLGEEVEVSPRGFRIELESAIKGKRTLATMEKALGTASSVILGRIRKARAVLDQFEEAHGAELILDRAELELRTADQVEAELRRRIDLRKAEAEKRKLREEAEKAKADATAAKKEVEEAKKPAPKPKKVGALPTGPSAAAEWAGFETAVMVAFKQLREAKAGLKHEENIERVDRFAGKINAAWKEAKRGEEVPA